MKKAVATLFSALALSACAHQINIVGRQSGAVGNASVTTAGNHGGPIKIAMNGKEYNGSWVFVSDGGAMTFASATARVGLATGTASGFGLAAATMGGGTILASAPDGSSLRCQFQYNQMGSTGLGVCQDNVGETYDLQIN